MSDIWFIPRQEPRDIDLSSSKADTDTDSCESVGPPHDVVDRDEGGDSSVLSSDQSSFEKCAATFDMFDKPDHMFVCLFSPLTPFQG